MTEQAQLNTDIPTGLLLGATQDKRHLLMFFVDDDGTKVWALHKRNFQYGMDGFAAAYDVPAILARTETLHAHHQDAMAAALDIFPCFCGGDFQKLAYTYPKSKPREEPYPDGLWYKQGELGFTELEDEHLMTRLNTAARNSFLFQNEGIDKQKLSYSPLAGEFAWMTLQPEWLPAWQAVWPVLATDAYDVFGSEEEVKKLRDALDPADTEGRSKLLERFQNPLEYDVTTIRRKIMADKYNARQHYLEVKAFLNTQLQGEKNKTLTPKATYMCLAAVALVAWRKTLEEDANNKRYHWFSNVYMSGWPENTVEKEAFAYVCGG